MKVKRFAINVVNKYDVSEKGSHVAVIMYSTEAKVLVRFNTFNGSYLNNVNITRAIEDGGHQRGLTFIDKALELADKELFTEEAGMRTDTKIRKVC